jgi:hypothetical protein
MQYQAFCQPSTWARIVLVITFANVIIYPLLTGYRILFYISSFINGIAFGVFLYCIIFLEEINIYGPLLLLFGIGIIILTPHFLAIQLLVKHLNNKKSKLLFLSGLCIFLMTACFFGIQYRIAIDSINKLKKSNYTSLDKNFMTEKIIGMYFKYHTEICYYDGWRPPIHEPALVIGQWLNNRLDPIGLGHEDEALKFRIKLYKKFFPAEKIKLDCGCAVEGSDEYFNDRIFDAY